MRAEISTLVVDLYFFLGVEKGNGGSCTLGTGAVWVGASARRLRVDDGPAMLAVEARRRREVESADLKLAGETEAVRWAAVSTRSLLWTLWISSAQQC
jgi:hypothetical protein